MKRTGFDERRDQQIADDFTANHSACRWCGMSTEKSVLSEYGARCGPCFTLYVTGGKPNPPMPTLERKRVILLRLKAVLQQRITLDPREWARRLQRREESGEKLTLFQRDAWRRALNVRDPLLAPRAPAFSPAWDDEEVTHAA